MIRDDEFLDKALASVEWPRHSDLLKARILNASSINFSPRRVYRHSAMFASFLIVSFFVGSYAGTFQLNEEYSAASSVYVGSGTYMAEQLFN